MNEAATECRGKAPQCPTELPANILQAAEALAEAYLKSPIRPRLSSDVLRHWDKLVEDWADSDLPLFVRKQSADIGAILPHGQTGRSLAPCDNSPAHWAVMTAHLRGTDITLDVVRAAIDRHEIPVTMAMSKAEILESTMKGVLARCRAVNAGHYGWKVDHIDEVGLKQRLRIEEVSIDLLKSHFKLLMKPSNIVLVPSKLKGLGDMSGFLTLLRKERTP
jgi:hypothetical protein